MPARRDITASFCAALLFSACSTGPELDIKIDESPQGTVYLKRISDGSLQAAHPVKIDASTIALVLNGLLVAEPQPAPKTPSGASDARPVFLGSEVGYLAPLISEGFRRAAPDQQVGFTIGQRADPAVSQSDGASKPSTTALLYAYGRSLYVTLTGFANRRLLFVPEAAKRPDTYLDTGSTGNTVVVDYELLARLPPFSAPNAAASAQPAPAPTAPQATSPGKQDPPSKEAEIEALRKELQEIKKQLADQQAERARSQSQQAVPRQ
jgi:hypothetical protein